jgi:hypothetical protein
MLCHGEKEERKNGNKYSRQSEGMLQSQIRSEGGPDLGMMRSVSVIEEENWRDKMTV